MPNSDKKKTESVRREEFVKNYIFGSSFFFGETVTEKDAKRAWAEIKNAKKKKRVKPKPQSKEEFVAGYLRGCEMWGETPTEEEINRSWDLIVFKRQYDTIGGKTRKQKQEKRNAFVEYVEQEMERRYPSNT